MAHDVSGKEFAQGDIVNVPFIVTGVRNKDGIMVVDLTSKYAKAGTIDEKVILNNVVTNNQVIKSE